MEVSMARKHFKDLASRLDAGDTDMRNISVDWINKNLGKLDQTFMSEEFLQQMTGTTPVNAVPADGSLTTPKYALKSITPEVTNFINVPDDGVVMDINTPTQAGHLDASTGEFIPSAMKTTVFIDLKPNVEYRLEYHATMNNGTEQLFPRAAILYDENENFVKDITHPNLHANIIHDVPMKVRVNYYLGVDGGVINDFRLFEIDYVPEFDRPTLGRSIAVVGESLENKSVDLSKLSNEVIDEFNPLLIDTNTPLLRGHLDFTTGDFVSNPNRNYTTDFIELEPNVDYKLEFRIIDGAGIIYTKPRVVFIYNGDNSKSRHIFANTETGVFRLTGTERKIRLNIGVTTDPITVEFLRLYKVSDGYQKIHRLGETIKVPASNVEGLDEVDSYDQSLNTSDDVSFASVSTSGTLPTGTLANPPIGLSNGDVWADTTDSQTHPILRVML